MPKQIISEEPKLARRLKGFHNRRTAARTEMLRKLGAKRRWGALVDGGIDWTLDFMEDMGIQMRSRGHKVGFATSLAERAMIQTLLKAFPRLMKTPFFGQRLRDGKTSEYEYHSWPSAVKLRR